MSLKYFLPLILGVSLQAHSQEMKVNLDEYAVKEEIADILNVNAQQIEVEAAKVEYAKALDDKVEHKGRVYITWNVKDIMAADGNMKYQTNGVTFTGNKTPLDGTSKGQIIGSVKIGYQFFENVGLDLSYERSSSTMEISSLNSGLPIGSINRMSVRNDFQTIKVGLNTSANLVKTTSFRMDLIGSVNGGAVLVDSTNKTKGDIYSGAIGYTYGAEAGVRVLHRSGVYVQTGVGMNNKVLAPITYRDGSSSSFNSSDKYVFISVGYSFGGKKRR